MQFLKIAIKPEVLRFNMVYGHITPSFDVKIQYLKNDTETLHPLVSSITEGL